MADEKEETARERVVRIARSWIDVPYLANGPDRSGIDCSRLIARVGAEAGLMPENAYVPLWTPPNPPPAAFDECMAPHFDRVPKEEMKPGDVVVLTASPSLVRVRKGTAGLPRHMFIVATRKWFPDLLALIGVAEGQDARVVEESLDDHHVERIYAVYRFKALAD